jgi:hypothetical protein
MHIHPRAVGGVSHAIQLRPRRGKADLRQTQISQTGDIPLTIASTPAPRIALSAGWMAERH